MFRTFTVIAAILYAIFGNPFEARHHFVHARNGVTTGGMWQDPYACANPAKPAGFTWCTGSDGWTVYSGTPTTSGTCSGSGSTSNGTCVVYVTTRTRSTYTGSIAASVLTVPIGTVVAQNDSILYAGSPTGTAAIYVGTQIDPTHWNLLQASGVTQSNVSITEAVGNDKTCTSYALPVTNTPALPCYSPQQAQSGVARRFNAPDWILLNRGDTFPPFNGVTNANILPQGKSQAEPLFIGPYGTGPYPVVKIGSSSSGVGGSIPCINLQAGSGGWYLAVQAIECYGAINDPTSQDYAGASVTADTGVVNCGVGFNGTISLTTASFTATMSASTTMNVTSVASGVIAAGATISGGGASGVVQPYGTGGTTGTGGVGTYVISVSQTSNPVASTLTTLTYNSGTAPIAGNTVVDGTTGVSLGTITSGANPTYTLSNGASAQGPLAMAGGDPKVICNVSATGGQIANVGATSNWRVFASGINGITLTANNYLNNATFTLSSAPIFTAKHMAMQINWTSGPVSGIVNIASNPLLFNVEGVRFRYTNISFQPAKPNVNSGAIVRIRRNTEQYGWSFGGGALGMFEADDDVPVYNEVIENLMYHVGYDDNVWGSSGTVFAHGYYLHGNNSIMRFQGNAVAFPSATGAQVRNGGLVSDNLVVGAPLSMNVNPGLQANTSISTYNVTTEGAEIPAGYRSATLASTLGDYKIFTDGLMTSGNCCLSNFGIQDLSNPGALPYGTVLFDILSAGDNVSAPYGVVGYGALNTNSTTATSSPVLHFANVASWVLAGMLAYDDTTHALIGTVQSTTSTSVTLIANAASAVGSNDKIIFSNGVNPGLRGDGVQPGDKLVIFYGGRMDGILSGWNASSAMSFPIGLQSSVTFGNDGSGHLLVNDSVSRQANESVVLSGSLPSSVADIQNSQTFYCVSSPGGSSYTIYSGGGSGTCNGTGALIATGTGGGSATATSSWQSMPSQVSGVTINIPGSGVAPISISGDNVGVRFVGEEKVFVNNGDSLPVADDTGQPLSFMTPYFVTTAGPAGTVYGLSRTVGGPAINVRSNAVSGTHIVGVNRVYFQPGGNNDYLVPQWVADAFKSGQSVSIGVSGLQAYQGGTLPNYQAVVTNVAPDRTYIDLDHVLNTGVVGGTILTGNPQSGAEQNLMFFGYTSDPDNKTWNHYPTTQIGPNNIASTANAFQKLSFASVGGYAVNNSFYTQNVDMSGNYFINWTGPTSSCNNGFSVGTGAICNYLDQGMAGKSTNYAPAQNSVGTSMNLVGSTAYPNASVSGYDAAAYGNKFTGTLSAIVGNTSGGWELDTAGSSDPNLFDLITGAGVPPNLHVVSQLGAHRFLVDQTLGAPVGPVAMRSGSIKDLFLRAANNQTIDLWDRSLTAPAINGFIRRNADCTPQSSPPCFKQL